MSPREHAQMTSALLTAVSAVAGNLALTPTSLTGEYLTFPGYVQVSVQFAAQDTAAVDILAEAFSLREDDETHPNYHRTGTAEIAGWTVTVVVYSGRPVDAVAEVLA